MFSRIVFLAVTLVFTSSTVACATSAHSGAAPKTKMGLEAKENAAPRDGAMFRTPKGRQL